MSSVPNVPVMKAIVVFIEHRQATRRIRIIRGGMIGGRPVGIVKDRVSFWRFELEAPIRQAGKVYFRRAIYWSEPDQPDRLREENRDLSRFTGISRYQEETPNRP